MRYGVYLVVKFELGGIRGVDIRLKLSRLALGGVAFRIRLCEAKDL